MKRIKRRYLALQIDTQNIALPSEREFMDAIWGSITQMFGESGASQANIVLINYSIDQKIVVIRVNLPAIINLRASIVTITQIAQTKVAVHVLAVSGTIKALAKKI